MTFPSDTPTGPWRSRLENFPRRPALIVAIVAALTLMVAITGPFGTYEHGNLWPRLTYWSVANGAAVAIAFSLKFAVRGLLRTRQFWIGELNIIVGTTLVFTPFLYAWTRFCFPTISRAALDPVMMGGNVLLICMLISALRYGLPYLMTLTGAPVPVQPLPRLVDRVPEAVRGPVLRLEAEGHFVLIVTRQGKARVRLRLSDAVREMDPIPGHHVHRSHWVAADAITGASDDTARSWLYLANGDQVPISRTYKPDLQRAGVL
ncbi:MAG: LytTR family DNA-binding domain-containing protein [Pseudomonadota bacterium]